MAQLNNYNIREHELGIWFFRLVLMLFATVFLLLFILKINETVTITQGEIIASNPQIDYKSPFEAQLERIKVKEGQHVVAGDTLMVISSNTLNTEYERKKTEAEYLEKRIHAISMIGQAMERRKNAIAQDSAINTRKHEQEIREITNDIQALEKQYRLQNQRISTANERFHADSILFQKEMLSKADYNDTKDANLLLLESQVKIESLKSKQESERDQAYTHYKKEQNGLFASMAELMQNIQTLFQSKNELEGQLMQAKESLKFMQTELGKENVIAKDSGIVNYMFNTHQTSNIINKGDLLATIAPGSNKYYAKAIVPQKDARHVKEGLPASLKLDAFYQFEHSLIYGKVTYMAERKENEKFYALIQLPETSGLPLRSGYTFQGEIILNEVPLYKYFFKMLFLKLDKE